MATFRRRGETWRAEIVARGRRESKTFGTKAAARIWAGEREAELGKGGAPTSSKSLRKVLERYAAEVSPGHKGERWERIRLAKIAREFDGIDLPVRDLTPDDIGRWRNKRLTEVSGASVAREMGLLRTVLSHACREWQALPRQKLDDLRGAKRPTSPPPRRRGVPQQAITAIVEALGYDDTQPITTISQRVAIAFLLGIETAMRCGEMCALTPADVHLPRSFVTLPATKNGDRRDVPLSAEAIRLFRRLPKGVPDLSSRQVDAHFRKARAKTSWSDVHFHDSRSEGITRMSRKLDLLALARVVGQRDPRSLMFYYAESAEALAARL